MFLRTLFSVKVCATSSCKGNICLTKDITLHAKHANIKLDIFLVLEKNQKALFPVEVL